jgi:hypothetical protein
MPAAQPHTRDKRRSSARDKRISLQDINQSLEALKDTVSDMQTSLRKPAAAGGALSRQIMSPDRTH